jgi:phosphatidate phosphatase APP1
MCRPKGFPLNARPAALLLCVLAPLAVGAAPAIYVAPALGAPRAVTLSGRVYKEAPSPGSSPLSRNLRRLTASNWVGAPLTLTFAGQTRQVRSGHDGEFEVTFTPGPGQGPFPSGLQQVVAQVPGARVRAPVQVVGEETGLLVISDFDDTVAHSRVREPVALLASALLHEGDTLPAVEGMADFYRCLRAPGGGRPAFALVSGSPVQYAPRLMRFLVRHGFPFFGLSLRNLGPGTLRGYKQPRIRQLLTGLSQPAVLVGDSGEHDPEVYAQMRQAFPGRIRHVYIRDAGGSHAPARLAGMTLFRHAREAAWDAVGRGLASEACVRAAFPAPMATTGGSP